jgi:hypothetical protein
MNILKKLFGGAAEATVGEVFKGIDKISTSGSERNEAKLQAIDSVVQTQCRIIEAEAKAGGLAATWRPVAALSFVAMVWWWALTPALGLVPPDLSQVPKEVWMFLMGYGTLREVGKTAGLFDKLKARGKKKRDQE